MGVAHSGGLCTLGAMHVRDSALALFDRSCHVTEVPTTTVLVQLLLLLVRLLAVLLLT